MTAHDTVIKNQKSRSKMKELTESISAEIALNLKEIT